jgi:nicotinamide phosphoribosyltransferase
MFLNPWLLTDFYKLTHILQYRPELRELTSYLTPRGSRLKGVDKVVFFGLSAYVHSYVVENFNKNFFNRPWWDSCNEVKEVLKEGLGYSDEMVANTINNLYDLHELGYLPVEIKAVAEGTLVPMGVPCLEIKSTNPQFFWVGQALEASLSAAIWHPMVSATIAREYRKIARGAFFATVENGIDERTAMCDFSMRGQESNESAVNASAAWLTSMWNSSTVAARNHIQRVYGECGNVRGLTSTEHSVMTSHACLDGGDEIPTFKYLFDLYKNVSFAAVCDSYDFWNVLTNILPNNFMQEIDERGKRGVFIGVRHDSAEPVDALCGTVPVITATDVKEIPSEMVDGDEKLFAISITIEEMERLNKIGATDLVAIKQFSKWGCKYFHNGEVVFRLNNLNGSGFNRHVTNDGNEIGWAVATCLNRPRTWEEKGMVETMYEIFGGSVNSKGYKVLNPGIKAVYGDSITITRAKKIYKRLAIKGFAANNVSLGVGSFSFQALENEDGTLSPFTRDTFSVAIKCTHSKYVDEYGTVCERHVFKDPKNFSGKKSQKGLCRIFFNEDGELTYEDELYEADLVGKNSALVTYFKDGQEFKQNFETIRETIDENL